MYTTRHSRSISPTSVNGRMGSTQTTKWTCSGTQTGTRPIKVTGTGVYRWCWRRGQNFILGIHSTKFETEICTVKACIMEKIENGYTGKNIYILSDSQAAIKFLDSFQINSKLVWDCHQLLVKLAECDRIQLVWLLRHVAIDGNEIADELAIQGSSHPLIGPEPVLGISAKVAREVIRGWTSRKCEEHWQADDFLRKPSATRAGELFNQNRS